MLFIYYFPSAVCVALQHHIKQHKSITNHFHLALAFHFWGLFDDTHTHSLPHCYSVIFMNEFEYYNI